MTNYRSIIIKFIAIIVLVGLYFLIAVNVDDGRVSALEVSIFNGINSLPNFLTPVMTVFQYSGLLLVPIVAAAFLIFKRQYLASAIVLLIIPIKIYLEKLSKAQFQRERPKVYIAEAILRGDVQSSGLSFYSGHAFIITAVATLLTPYLGKKGLLLIWGIAIGCLFARIYLGAHLPLDVVAGACLGIASGLMLLIALELISIVKNKFTKDTASLEQSETQ